MTLGFVLPCGHMAVTGSWPVGKDLLDQQIERLVKSPLLQSSESLCRLLVYLADQAWTNPGVPVKEYQIATEVFGRPPNFDPRLDSTVRVQTGRLRSKLAEYYANAATVGELLIEVPRGSYMVVYQVRPPEPPKAEPVPPPPAVASRAPAAEPRADWRTAALIILGIAAVGSSAVAGYLWSKRPPAPVLVEQAVPAPLLTLWADFIGSGDHPLIVYSNAEFIGQPVTGMRYFDPRRDRRQDILDHYTGVGEVIGVFELDHLFTSVRTPLRVKRGRLLSLDDAKSSDLIFIGSPSENLILREIPSTQEFVFRNSTGERKGDLAIFNQHPRAGEPVTFFATPNPPLKEDYALVALLPGLGPDRRAMLLAGLTTLGTQAAVEFVTRTGSATELLDRLGVRTGNPMRPFEAVLRVTVTGGVPVQTQIVLARAK